MAKSYSLWWIHFVLSILFVWTLTFERAVLYVNVVFSIEVVSANKNYSSVLKEISESLFQIQSKNFKWSSHKNMQTSWGPFQKSLF